jgi:hypothetical protein
MSGQNSAARLADVGAEEALLGSLLQPDGAGVAIDAIAEVVEPQDFTARGRSALYRALLHLRGRGLIADGADLVVVADELRRRDELDIVGGPLELTRLVDRVPSAANVAHHARIVRELADRRRLIAAYERAAAACSDLATPLDSIKVELSDAVALSPLSSDFEYLNLDDIAAKGVPPIDWLVPRWLVRGDVAIVAGPAYSGKSTTISDLMVAIASGRSWCGIAPTTTGDVLAFDEEQGEAATARLFLRLGAKGLTRLRVASGQGVNVAAADGFARLEREIAKACPLVVMLDSATQVFAGIDENSAEQVAPIFGRLFKLRDKYGTTFVILHHLKKPPAEGKVDLLASVRGTTAWGTQASTVWVAQRVDDVTIDLLQAKRRGASPTSLRISYSEECGGGGAITLSGGTRPDPGDAKRLALHESIRGVLAGDPARFRTRVELRDEVGGRQATLNEAVTRMIESGELEPGKAGGVRLRDSAIPADSRSPESGERSTAIPDSPPPKGGIRESRNGPGMPAGRAAIPELGVNGAYP